MSRKPKKEATEIKLAVRVEPEVRKRLKVQAAQEGVSMQEKLNEILCRALDFEPTPAA